MSSMAEAIIPKSDQLNADDLIAGPMTITITDVSIRGGTEQPVSIHFEGDNGKPYKSCKSMNRVLVTAWGADAKKYVGRSLTLYRDPTVKWAGMEVGGIRISHMSHIDSPLTMALTMTKQNKRPFTVKPLEAVQTKNWPQELNNAATLADLGAVWKQIPSADKEKYLLIKDQRKELLQRPSAPPDDFVGDYTATEQKGPL